MRRFKYCNYLSQWREIRKDLLGPRMQSGNWSSIVCFGICSVYERATYFQIGEFHLIDSSVFSLNLSSCFF